MATIRRAGFGTVFELEDSKVGIGTDAATHTLQALGNIRSEAATDIGISSLSTYQGFPNQFPLRCSHLTYLLIQLQHRQNDKRSSLEQAQVTKQLSTYES